MKNCDFCAGDGENGQPGEDERRRLADEEWRRRRLSSSPSVFGVDRPQLFYKDESETFRQGAKRKRPGILFRHQSNILRLQGETFSLELKYPNAPASLLTASYSRCVVRCKSTGWAKNDLTCFCQIFVKSRPNLIFFGILIAKTIKICKVHSLSTSLNFVTALPSKMQILQIIA